MLSAEERYRLLEEASALSADREYALVLRLLDRADKSELLGEPELGLLLAQARFGCGDIDRALALTQSLAYPCLSRGRDRLYCRRLLFEGNLSVEIGDLAKGTECYSEVLAIATRMKDQRLIAATTLNLGTIAWLQCDYLTALAEFQRAIAAYDSLLDDYKLAGCHHNLAMAYKEIGLMKESGIHFEKSYALYSEAGGPKELAFNAYERALLMTLQGDAEAAEVTALRALNSVRDLGKGREEGEALRVLGIIHRELAQHARARRELVKARRIARRNRARLLEAEALEELAVLYTDGGDFRRAENYINKTIGHYFAMGAPTRAAKALARIRSAGFSRHRS